MYFWHKVFKTYSEVTGCKMKSDKQVAKWLKDPYSDSAEYKTARKILLKNLSGSSAFKNGGTEHEISE